MRQAVFMTVISLGFLMALVFLSLAKPKSPFNYYVDEKVCLLDPADSSTIETQVLANFKYKEVFGYVIEILPDGGVQLVNQTILDKYRTACK